MEVNLLKQEDIDYARKKLKETLKKVPKGKRVPINSRLLEQLLFEEIDLGLDRICKLPVWSGEFLSKIDLSNISFADVSWTFLAGGYANMPNLAEDKVIKLKEIIKKNKIKSQYSVDYANTNANINFLLSWESTYDKKMLENAPTISDCNFNGTDLKESRICKSQRVVNCSFESASIELVYGSTFENCSFCGCYFANDTIDLISYLSGKVYSNCNFKNTKMKFHLRNYSELMMDSKWLILEQLNQRVLTGFLDGCYIEEKEVPFEDDKKERYCYDALGLQMNGVELIDSVISEINQQILSFNKPNE